MIEGKRKIYVDLYSGTGQRQQKSGGYYPRGFDFFCFYRTFIGVSD